MIIGNPAALLLLLLLPLIILLHILLRRMEKKDVSSLIIWERVRKKRKYRFPSILLLLLQLLTALFLTFSLSDIRIPLTIPMRRENSVLIIDNSASMAVVEEGRSRLEDAREKAVNVIKGSLGEVMIITSSDPPRIISSYSRNRDELIRAVKSIEQTELANGVEEAMKIAGASVLPEGSIIMISDGAFGYLPSERDNFKFIRAGKEQKDNGGIVDFRLRKKVTGGIYELFISMADYSAFPLTGKLSISRNGEPIVGEDILFNPGEITSRIYDIEAGPENLISAQLSFDGADLLESDNRAAAYIGPEKSRRILLISPGNFFLEKALDSLADVDMEKYSGMAVSDDPLLFNSSGIPVQQIPDNFDLVIYDRIPPVKEDKNGRFIYIDTLPSGLRDSGEKVRPQAIGILGEHPVTRSLDLTGVTILQAREEIRQPAIRELVSGGNTGLLYSFESPFLRFVYIPFDLVESDLPLRASFPVLIDNAVSWLTEDYRKEDISQNRTGDMLSAGKALPSVQEGEALLPSGRKVSFDGTDFSDTEFTGLYRLVYNGETSLYSVNLCSADESDISPRFPEVTEENREEKTGEYKFPMIALFLLISLIILSAEWLLQEDKW